MLGENTFLEQSRSSADLTKSLLHCHNCAPEVQTREYGMDRSELGENKCDDNFDKLEAEPHTISGIVSNIAMNAIARTMAGSVRIDWRYSTDSVSSQDFREPVLIVNHKKVVGL